MYQKHNEKNKENENKKRKKLQTACSNKRETKNISDINFKIAFPD